MNTVLVVFLLTFSAQMATTQQQCRQVTVCNDDVISSVKGQKGEAGNVGKDGPLGEKGARGASGIDGEKGMQGESCALGSLGDEIIKKLRDLENLLIAPTTMSTTVITTTPMITTNAATPASCASSSVNGRQTLRSGEEVYCEDGWRVFQKRFDGSVDFQLNWNAYKTGFGNLSGEFWLGLNKIHALTSSGNCRLRVDILDFDDDQAFAEYSSFSVDDESDLYRLNVTGYSGTAGNSLRFHNNAVFSTFDRDNDGHSYNCASHYGRGSGGWWFTSGCFFCALNAAWGRSEGYATNIIWYQFTNTYSEALKTASMKLRCD